MSSDVSSDAGPMLGVVRCERCGAGMFGTVGSVALSEAGRCCGDRGKVTTSSEKGPVCGEWWPLLKRRESRSGLLRRGTQYVKTEGPGGHRPQSLHIRTCRGCHQKEGSYSLDPLSLGRRVVGARLTPNPRSSQPLRHPPLPRLGGRSSLRGGSSGPKASA